MPDPRVLPTMGVHNFRDYGGYPMSSGGRLALGRLYRSGDLSHATDVDLKLVAGLGLTDAFDLRGSKEREKEPCRWPPGFKASVFAADGETTVAAPHVEAAAAAFDAETARRTLCERYSSVPFRPVLVEVYGAYFRALDRGAAASLAYCTAGKDRTGVLVALLHTAVGVHPDDILEDYLLTNTVGDTEKRVAALRDDLQRRFGAQITEEGIRVVTSVEPVFLESAFRAIRQRHGTIDNYLEQVLGVTQAVRERLCSSLAA
jgi:protein-tyrosine phosphatase